MYTLKTFITYIEDGMDYDTQVLTQVFNSQDLLDNMLNNNKCRFTTNYSKVKFEVIKA